MNNLKQTLYSFLISLGILLVLTLLLSVFHYFDLISNFILKWSKILIPLISIFIGGLLNGRKASKKGYLKGLEVGGLMVLFMFLISILGFYSSIHIFTFIYYILVLLFAMLGAIIGIQKKIRH